MELNNHLTKAEEFFNVAGGVPIVAIVSGALRSLAGAVQAFVGMIFGFIGLVGMFFNPQNRKWEQMANSGFENFGHGGMNFFRGIGEYLLGLTIVGSIALFVCQGASPNKFQPIIKYDQKPEEQRQETRELVPAQA